MTDNLWKKLAAIQADLANSPLVKQNKQGVPFPTLSHDTVNAAVNPLFIKYGVIAIARVVDDSFETITVSTRQGEQPGYFTRARVEVEYINVDDPGQRETVVMVGQGIDTADKGAGKCISYAVKYAHLKTFGLSTTDDPENEHIERSAPRASSKTSAPYTSGGGDDRIQFGKHKGTLWTEVPSDYLDWLSMQQGNKYGNDKKALRELERRAAAVDEPIDMPEDVEFFGGDT